MSKLNEKCLITFFIFRPLSFLRSAQFFLATCWKISHVLFLLVAHSFSNLLEDYWWLLQVLHFFISVSKFVEVFWLLPCNIVQYIFMIFILGCWNTLNTPQNTPLCTSLGSDQSGDNVGFARGRRGVVGKKIIYLFLVKNCK